MNSRPDVCPYCLLRWTIDGHDDGCMHKKLWDMEYYHRAEVERLERERDELAGRLRAVLHHWGVLGLAVVPDGKNDDELAAHWNAMERVLYNGPLPPCPGCTKLAAENAELRKDLSDLYEQADDMAHAWAWFCHGADEEREEAEAKMNQIGKAILSHAQHAEEGGDDAES